MKKSIGSAQIINADQMRDLFQDQFHASPDLIARAPGRVNLIGEHTDYNDGFVLPMAVDRAIWMAVRPRVDLKVHLWSLDFDQSIEFPLISFERAATSPGEYVKGVAWSLQEAGYPLIGFEGVVLGDVPIGAGLSSSAALEVVTAKVFAALSGITLDSVTIARLAQRAENEWLGLRSGVMDQMISAAGVADHALLIDCRTLKTSANPLPSDTSIVIMDTGIRRELVDSAYNERRQECEAAAKYLGVSSLRDFDLKSFNTRIEGMDEILVKRARHVLTENKRTLQAAQAMQGDDPELLGKLMRESHLSMRDDFQISCAELDIMVEIANARPECFGARMTGGGFGGCAVALVTKSGTVAFVDQVAAEYKKMTGIRPPIYVSEAVQGASVE